MNNNHTAAKLLVVAGSLTTAAVFLVHRFNTRRTSQLCTKVDEVDEYNPELVWWMDPYLQRIASNSKPVYLSSAVSGGGDSQNASAIVVKEFGAATRAQHFVLEEDVAFLNHGSYGAAFKCTLEESYKVMLQLEAQPVRYMEMKLLPGLADAQHEVAAFLRCRSQDVVFVENATTAVNAVVSSFPLCTGDVVLVLSVVYAAVRHTVERAAARVGARVVVVSVGPPYSTTRLLSKMREALTSHPTAVLAVLDHISSQPAMVLPVRELAQLCREHGVKVMIDGAHAVGQLALDVPSLGADYYTSSWHKWMYCPKGTAFLWVREECQAGVRPTIASHGFGGGFASEFTWKATADYSRYLSIPRALEVVAAYGHDNMLRYSSDLITWAAYMCAGRWDTSVLRWEEDKDKPIQGALANVVVPRGHFSASRPGDAVALHLALRDEGGVEVPVFDFGGELYVRLSAAMYNKRSEYEQLANAMLRIQQVVVVKK